MSAQQPLMVYYFMGKASGKKQSSSQAGKQKSLHTDSSSSKQAGELTGLQANKQSDQQAGKLVSRQAIHVLIIVVIGLLAYSNTFQSPFQWDESDFIVGNPVVRDLDYFAGSSKTEGLPVIEGFKSRYIGYLTFALNYKLHGFNVFGYHVVNLAIHLTNAILVYFLVLLTFRTPYFKSEKSEVSSKKEDLATHYSLFTTSHSRFTIHNSRFFSLAVALLFVTHPIQTEAVTYVFQRFASLVSLFYLLSLVLYIKARQSAVSHQQSANSPLKKGVRGLSFLYYFLSLLSAVLAMKTKENAFTLPVIMTLYEFLFFSGAMKTRLLRLAPFLLTMLIIPAAILGAGATAGEIIGEIKDPTSLGYEEISGKEYLFTQFRVIVTYLRLLFFPINQNLVHDYPIYRSFFTLPVLLSFLFLSALFGTAVYLMYKSQSKKSVVSSEKGKAENDDPNTDGFSLLTTHYSQFTICCFRLIAFGILWFFITLSVESGIIPIPMVMDEYRIYLPSVGFFIALAAGVALLLNQGLQFTIHNSRFIKVAAALFALIILGLASATYARNILWKDKVILWEDVLRKSPSSSRAYNNLGLAYNEKGLRERAIGMYLRSISANPRFSLAYSNLGVAYAGIGQTDAAIESFTKALALNPKNVVAYANLARAYGETGHLEKAAENYNKVISLSPYDSAAYHRLGTAYVMLGRLDDAVVAYNKFIDLSPKDPEAYRSRGIVFAKKGDSRSALQDFEKSCALGSRESCEYLKSGRL
ncbi:MAG: tetratricopeptide repeat protein [Thermodesulfovibrionales bacterium]